MAFPGWVFRQRGFLVALEFVTQELRHTVQVRFQVHRPELGEDCEETTNITGLPLASQGNGTRSPLDCSAGFQWCPWSNACLPLESCCDPAMCANGSAASKADPNPCLHENHLRNRLLEESFFDVLPGPSKQYLLLFRGKDAFVGPNDTISIQHDAGPGAFLLCHPSPVPSDPISYLTSTSSDWDPGFLAHDAASSWRNDSVCFLRVLFMAEETVPIIGRENSGVDRYGLYSVRATVDNGVFTTNLSCNFWAVPPVQGLCVIYPAVQDGKIYVPTNRTWLVVKVSSRVNASAGWLGGNQSFPFERHCPPTVAPLTAECARETKDSWFSVITLDGIGQNFSTVVLWAENAVSSQNISIMVKAEEPIRGLRATPDPETRVLLNKRVSYVPMMDAGSDVTFRWTVDDKPSFTFYNNVFKVVYQTPAVYKLSLTASNHVSNVTVNYNITVEKMNRMKDLMVSEIPSLIPQNTTVDLSAVVTVDSAVDATFL
uniref:polycystin-1-like n=1 Tax=Euleptes europaea TaxID=460621 RepID=UPI00253FD83D|nr:polycystin-1-like [Euleptes europaea]